MCIKKKVSNKILKINILLALLSIFESTYSQYFRDGDTIIKTVPLKSINVRQNFRLFSGDQRSSYHDSIIPSGINTGEFAPEIYRSIRNRTSIPPLAKKLLDLIIVPQYQVESKRITGKSENYFLNYKGKIIRDVSIRRLDAFGVNIDNPYYYEPNRIQELLNRLHVNTNERIIRKNLLFAGGDTISPILLSDNERILRQLPYIDDARILVIPVGANEADVIVVTKDVFSLGASLNFSGLKKGSVEVFEKNLAGIGHELGVVIPYDTKYSDSPGFGFNYSVNNINKTFADLKLNYINGLGNETYGLSLTRRLFSSSTRYAGGIDLRRTFTSEDLDTLLVPHPLKYNFQDYWFSRSFILNPESVSRITLGIRYTNNNVFCKPEIQSDSYYSLQKYRIYLGEVAFSMQKYYKTNLIYGYGRVEDIPYGGLLKLTAGHEVNEFKTRSYLGSEISFGGSMRTLGYFYGSAGLAAFLNDGTTEQGILSLKLKYFSNLLFIGNNRIRNFVIIDFTRGINRYRDEYLKYIPDNGLSGFRNDSITGNRRLNIGLESVLFSSFSTYGFRFAFFGFADFSFLSCSHEVISGGNLLSGIGLGVRIRNNNLVLNTLQIRLGFFPNLPPYSKTTTVTVSGEQLLRPYNFDPGPPSVIRYR